MTWMLGPPKAHGATVTNCIEITCPGNIVRSTCSNGVPVTFTLSASNRCNPTSLSAGCSPASGSTFALGDTPVNCWAIGSGETNRCGFTVSVVRSANCPPTNCIEIRCPEDIIKSTCSVPLPVSYSVWASNRCSPPNISTWCSPPSGSPFGLGNTRVDCYAVGSGQTNQCSFTVVVVRDPNCPSDCSTNLLVNGSFEDPGHPGWLCVSAGR